MIVGFIGDPESDRNMMGTGKTLLMSVRAYKRHLKGERVIANYGLRFPHEKADSDTIMRLVKENQSLDRCVLALTEIHVILESRRSSSERNITISYFILQTRKRGVTLFYDSQDMMQVEKRLRLNTDIFVFCKRVGKHSFRYRVFTRSGRSLGGFVLDARKYYRVYDTTETVVDFAK